MYTSEIAIKYRIDKQEFEQFLIDADYPYKSGLLGMSLDADIEEAIIKFKRLKAKEYQYHEIDRKRREEEEAQRQEILSSVLITSCSNFDGYRIVKYLGYISGDGAIEVNRGLDGGDFMATGVSAGIMNTLKIIRKSALDELKEAALNLGCNAVVGVNYDYITLEPETANSTGGTLYLPYVFAVTANGTAVVIQKNDE